MDGGLESSKVLATAIKESTVFLFLASKNSYESKYTRNEVAYVFNKKEDPQIIPYIIDGSTLPDELELTLSSFKCRDMRQHPIQTVVEDVLEKIGQKSDSRYSPAPALQPIPDSKIASRKRKLWPWLAAVLAVALVVILAMRGCSGTKSEDENGGQTPVEENNPVPAGYVDLGLSVYWKDSNENGYYTYDEAVSKFGSRLPTNAQLQELIDKCKWAWTGRGYRVTGPNGNSIFLPAAGYRYCDGDVDYVGTFGYYWSSTPCDSEIIARNLCFHSSGVDMGGNDRCCGRSVRLVQGK
jgi:hypothetical protein